MIAICLLLNQTVLMQTQRTSLNQKSLIGSQQSFEFRARHVRTCDNSCGTAFVYRFLKSSAFSNRHRGSTAKHWRVEDTCCHGECSEHTGVALDCSLGATADFCHGRKLTDGNPGHPNRTNPRTAMKLNRLCLRSSTIRLQLSCLHGLSHATARP